MKKRIQLAVSSIVFSFLCYSILFHHQYAGQSLHDELDRVQKFWSLSDSDSNIIDESPGTVVPSSISTSTSIFHQRASPTSSSSTAFTTISTASDYVAEPETGPEDVPNDLEHPVPPTKLEDPEQFNSTVYAQAIVSTEDNHFPRLFCPAPTTGRYNYLKMTEKSKPKFFFALDLHQSAKILPRLLGTVVETMHFLGPEICELSVVEGRSTDGTPDILEDLKTEVERIGARYYLTTSGLNPMAGEGVDRIKALADLRNLALAPLFEYPDEYDADTTVLFINDIALCMEDLLELIHQKVCQDADMTCAMDWINNGENFYDVWISRGINGDQFFEIPQNGGWEYSKNLFWNDGETRDRLNHGRPFQVFACWNGVVAFSAKPLLEQQIKFRSAREGECYLGEPVHFCKDLWKLGYGKIAVVPTVNVAYDDEQSHRVKEWHGSVSKWTENEEGEENIITWKHQPPQFIKCVPTYQNPSWVPWDQ